MPALILLVQPDCGLCAAARRWLPALARRAGCSYEECDVRTDPELERRFLLEVPVVLLDGEPVATPPLIESLVELAVRSRLRARGST